MCSVSRHTGRNAHCANDGRPKGASPAVLFLDVVMESPAGPLQLENRYYKLGTRAAAAIAAKHDQAGLVGLF